MSNDDVDEWLRRLSADVVAEKAESRVAQRALHGIRPLLRTGEMDRRIVRSYLSGSYVRHTATTPINDVDIIFEIDETRWRPAPWSLLGDELPAPEKVLTTFANALRARLRENGDASRVRKQGRSVGVIFEDMHVDVVPAVPTEGGDEDFNDHTDDDATEGDDEETWEDRVMFERVLIPDRRRDQWIDSNPRAHVRISSYLNRESGGLFKPAVRLVKTWNDGQRRPVSSFVIETLVGHVFETFEFSSLLAAVGGVWEFMAVRGGLDGDRDSDGSPVCLKRGLLSSATIPDLAATGLDLAESCDADSLVELVARADRARQAIDAACGARLAATMNKRLDQLFQVETV